ncbi:hypothetical protein NKR23_g7245 [Pleurostoma richardsiae]|uniref:Uncharacterized protein n=1 Tax=Pleurostoma richardsiae TaxID=41990 RepID=A0AA38RC39_9PEZI|nr:hypothetical protein NKR23_g7245 [Pleurostoma richardsiae]
MNHLQDPPIAGQEGASVLDGVEDSVLAFAQGIRALIAFSIQALHQATIGTGSTLITVLITNIKLLVALVILWVQMLFLILRSAPHIAVALACYCVILASRLLSRWKAFLRRPLHTPRTLQPGPNGVSPAATTYTTAYPTTTRHYNKNDSSPAPTTNRIAKSRTFGVLSSLSLSFSRSSLSNIANNSTGRKPSSSSISSSEAPKTKTRLPRASLPSSRTMPSMEQRPSARPPTTNPRLITSAQPSAYWSGRFTALHDRFLNELLTPRNLQTLADAHAEEYGIPDPPPPPPASRFGSSSSSRHDARIPPSATSSAILQRRQTPGEFRSVGQQSADALNDDDSRCRRVFLHLQRACVTGEARQSLHEWQQAYARKTGRRALLPEGGTMEERGLVARWFGVGKRGGKRMTIA